MLTVPGYPRALVFAVLFALFLLSAFLQGVWHFWRRETHRAHIVITSLGFASLLLAALGLLLSHMGGWLLLAAAIVGPVMIALDMAWSWFAYEGPPQEFEPLPKALDKFEDTITRRGDGMLNQPQPPEEDGSSQSDPK